MAPVVTINTPLSTDNLTINSGLAALQTNGASVIKTGAGTVNLNGTSNYTGATTISSGTLVVGGTLSSSAVTVAAGTSAYGGATLRGNGTVGGTVALSAGAAKQGGIIAAGASSSPSTGIGTLTTGAETWNNGAVYQWKIGSSAGTYDVNNGYNGTPGSTYDLLVTGGLTVPSSGAAVTIAPQGAVTGVAPGTYVDWAIAQVGNSSSTIAESGGSPIAASYSNTVPSSIFALDTGGLTIDGAAINAYSSFSLYFETVGVGGGATNDLVLSGLLRGP